MLCHEGLSHLEIITYHLHAMGWRLPTSDICFSLPKGFCPQPQQPTLPAHAGRKCQRTYTSFNNPQRMTCRGWCSLTPGITPPCVINSISQTFPWGRTPALLCARRLNNCYLSSLYHLLLPVSSFWNHLPSKLLALKFSSQSLYLTQSKLKHWSSVTFVLSLTPPLTPDVSLQIWEIQSKESQKTAWGL